MSDDVCWDNAGATISIGKEEFRKEINNDNFEGAPTIKIKTEIAEGDYVQ